MILHGKQVLDRSLLHWSLSQLHVPSKPRRIEILVGWLHENIDTSSGLWGKSTRKEGWLQPVNGFYRLTRGLHAQFGVKLPLPETTIDTVLSYIRRTIILLLKI